MHNSGTSSGNISQILRYLTTLLCFGKFDFGLSRMLKRGWIPFPGYPSNCHIKVHFVHVAQKKK